MNQATLLQHQIRRMANIYLSRPVGPRNILFHRRVMEIQVRLIKEKKQLLKSNRIK
jgi:hypothetical protein